MQISFWKGIYKKFIKKNVVGFFVLFRVLKQWLRLFMKECKPMGKLIAKSIVFPKNYMRESQFCLYMSSGLYIQVTEIDIFVYMEVSAKTPIQAI